MPDKPAAPPVPKRPGLIQNLELKVGLLLAATLVLGLGQLAYGLYARGVFSKTQTVVLTAGETFDVTVGMPLTFRGFPIGTVKRVALTQDGQVRMEVAVKAEDAKWLREHSVFTLEKGLVGGAKIKVHTTDLKDKALADKAERPLFTGDATQEIPAIIAEVKGILANARAMTADESAINRSLAHVETLTGRMAGEGGVLHGVFGTQEKADEVAKVIRQANTLMGNVNGISLKVDDMLGKADTQLFAENGALPQARQSVEQINRMLGELRESLKKVDASLASAQTATANVATITGNVKDATADMATLRVEIDDSVRKVNHLITELNKKWPFARDVEISTP